MDAFTLAEFALAAAPCHGEVAARFQVHLDTRQFRIEETAMLPVSHHEIAAEEAIDVQQRVAVERRRHAERVVVGRIKRFVGNPKPMSFTKN